ncbi:MAG: HYExAFE family protein, partial [Phycisphaerales bacterium]|nr:HYExAFE family protein [Phycisphaerales bacterium]
GGGGGGGGSNLLIDIKGRRVGSSRSVKGDSALLAGRLESWVTMDDVDSLRTWEGLFGPGFQAAFIFVYWCDRQPPDALFQEIFEYRGVWYALRAVTLRAYAEHMKIRSPRWRTVDVPRAAFERITQPFAPSPSGFSSSANGLFDPGPEVPALLPLQSSPSPVPWGARPTL